MTTLFFPIPCTFRTVHNRLFWLFPNWLPLLRMTAVTAVTNLTRAHHSCANWANCSVTMPLACTTSSSVTERLTVRMARMRRTVMNTCASLLSSSVPRAITNPASASTRGRSAMARSTALMAQMNRTVTISPALIPPSSRAPVRTFASHQFGFVTGPTTAVMGRMSLLTV